MDDAGSRRRGKKLSLAALRARATGQGVGLAINMKVPYAATWRSVFLLVWCALGA